MSAVAHGGGLVVGLDRRSASTVGGHTAVGGPLVAAEPRPVQLDLGRLSRISPNDRRCGYRRASFSERSHIDNRGKPSCVVSPANRLERLSEYLTRGDGDKAALELDKFIAEVSASAQVEARWKQRIVGYARSLRDTI